MQDFQALSRQQKIKRIIERRQPLVERLEKVEESIKNFCSLLNELGGLKQQLTEKFNFTEIAGDIGNFDPFELKKELQEQLNEIGKLKRRFSRDKIYIGVVGQGRQGKSRLLRSITGLSRNEIPDGSRGFCTGVRSTIINESGGQPFANIWFYSENEFIEEVIEAYYLKLKLPGKPTSLDEFERGIPSAPQELGPKFKTMYDHLKRDYHANLDSYRSRFRERSPKHVGQSEIRQFVAQDNEQGERIYYDYLAVKEAEIHCSFPRSEDFGQIALVDLPGLGDTGVGDDQRLAQTLKDDIDFVLFVRKPNRMGDDWNSLDEDVYQLVYEQFTDLARRSFMILNRTEFNAEENTSDNLSNCEYFRDRREIKNIQIQECIIANCSSSEEAGGVLDRVLDYLVEDVTFLDEHYAQPYQDKLVRTKEKIQAQLRRDGKSLNTLENADALFQRELFPKLWRNLTGGLEDLLDELYSKRNKQDPTFKTKVQEAITLCREDSNAVDPITEIKALRNEEGSYKIAYLKCLFRTQVRLTKHFLQLDTQMQQLLESVKEQIVIILKTQGKLQSLVSAQKAEFLTNLVALIEDDSDFKLGFSTLHRYNIPLERGIPYRISQHIDALSPDKNDFPSRRLFKRVMEEVVKLVSEEVETDQNSISLASIPSKDDLEKSLQPIEDIFSDSSSFNIKKTIELVIQFVKSLATDKAIIPLAALQSVDKLVDLLYPEIIKEEKIYELLTARYNEVVDQCETTLLLMSNIPNEIAFDMVETFIKLVLRSSTSKVEWQVFLNKHRDAIWDEFRRMREYKEEQENWLRLVSNAKIQSESFFIQFLD